MRLRVGRVVRAHGVLGELAVAPTTDRPEERFSAGQHLTIAGRASEVLSSRRHGERWLLRLGGVDDRDAAQRLVGQAMWAEVDTGEPVDDMGAPDDLAASGDVEEIHDIELRGMTVVGPDDRVVGVVEDVLHYPAQDLLAVRSEQEEVLVPFVSAIVVEVDRQRRRLSLADLPGLVDMPGEVGPVHPSAVDGPPNEPGS